MKHWFIISSVLLAAIAMYFGIHSSITREAREVSHSECPELAWLQREYQLNEEQYQKVQKLHKEHDSLCIDLCKQLSQSQQAFSRAFATLDPEAEEFQTALRNWREAHKQSQDAIIKHAGDISSVMEPEQGRLYRQRVYNRLLLPGRTPHIDTEGRFDENFVPHLEN